jgi:hypothetical protein
MMLMTQANDLVIVFLGLELLSLSLYVLVGFLRHNLYSNESGLKYLLLGAFATGFFLFGAALTYGATGTTNFNGIAEAIASGAILSDVFLSLGLVYCSSASPSSGAGSVPHVVAGCVSGSTYYGDCLSLYSAKSSRLRSAAEVVYNSFSGGSR